MTERTSVVADRKVAALRQAMGPVIAAALADKRVVEVMVNPDGKIWIDKIGGRPLLHRRTPRARCGQPHPALARRPCGGGGHEGSATD